MDYCGEVNGERTFHIANDFCAFEEMDEAYGEQRDEEAITLNGSKWVEDEMLRIT